MGEALNSGAQGEEVAPPNPFMRSLQAKCAADRYARGTAIEDRYTALVSLLSSPKLAPTVREWLDGVAAIEPRNKWNDAYADASADLADVERLAVLATLSTPVHEEGS